MSYDTPENILLAWQESAAYWEKHRSEIESIFGPVTDALVSSAAITTGQAVLDVAGGIGEPSLEVAEVVGSAGRVVHTDPVPEMLAATRREAERRGLSNLTSQQAMAGELPFDDNTFDATVCRFGAMFFPIPAAALREMLRVTRPGGSIALAVWAHKKLNPFFSVVTDVMAHFVEPDPEQADSPGAFRFAEPGRLVTILAEAGADAVVEKSFPFRMRAPLSIEQYWPLRLDLSDTLRGKVGRLSVKQRVQVIAEVEAAAHESFVSGTMDFPAQALIVSGRKRP